MTLKKQWMLLVDDAEIFSKPIEDFIRWKGFDTKVCKTKDDAIKAISDSSASPLLIIMDVRLPGGCEGIAAAGEIWDLQLKQGVGRTTTVFISVLPESHYRAHIENLAKKCNMSMDSDVWKKHYKYIEKPVDFLILTEIIRGVIL